MAVPFLVVILRVTRYESGEEVNERMTAPDATKYVHGVAGCVVDCAVDRYIFGAMFSPTIMLLIGGFTIASAISKTSIDRVLITRLLSFAGTRPSVVLLAFMGVACFASMWIRLSSAKPHP